MPKKFEIDTFTSWSDWRIGFCFTRIDKCCWTLELQFLPFYIHINNSIWQCPNDAYCNNFKTEDADACEEEFIDFVKQIKEKLGDTVDEKAIVGMYENWDFVKQTKEKLGDTVDEKAIVGMYENWDDVKVRLGLGGEK